MRWLRRLWDFLTTGPCEYCDLRAKNWDIDMWGACPACQRETATHRWDSRLDGVTCEECMLRLSREVWGTCTREPTACWGTYAIMRFQELDADDTPQQGR